jgi:hypothetical protein
MSVPQEDYWPEHLAEVPVITPATVLKEQAALLGQKTKNLIVGRVESRPDEDKLRHVLYLMVPTLSNYRYFLLSITNDLSIYPIKINDATNSTTISAEDLEDFRAKLKEILSSDRVKRIIETLLSYASTSRFWNDPSEDTSATGAP